MNRNKSVQTLTLTALLIACAIIIPMFSVGLRFEPFFSYTLASHVPLFFAMFISPLCAILVAVGSAIGFLFSTGNPMIVARAGSHLVFAVIGALWIIKKPNQFKSLRGTLLFSFVIAIIHSICEFLVVIPFVMEGLTPEFLGTMFIFLVIFGVVHSMVDFEIANRIVRVTLKNRAS